MATTGIDRGGRRSKGARRQISTRMPVPDADKLIAVAQASGVTVNDYLAALVADHLKTIHVDQISQQEALPIDKAS